MGWYQAQGRAMNSRIKGAFGVITLISICSTYFETAYYQKQ